MPAGLDEIPSRLHHLRSHLTVLHLRHAGGGHVGAVGSDAVYPPVLLPLHAVVLIQRQGDGVDDGVDGLHTVLHGDLRLVGAVGGDARQKLRAVAQLPCQAAEAVGGAFPILHDKWFEVIRQHQTITSLVSRW